MNISSMGNKLRIAPGFCFLSALWLLLLPMRWGVGALLAASVHELFHCLAVWFTGGQVLSFTLGSAGARIEASPMTAGREALCALAGPLGSFAVLPLAEHFPEAAVCALIQGAFNLLPIYPLDGGRVLRCMLPMAVCAGMEVFALTLLSGLCLWAGGLAPELGLILLLSLWFPVIQRKISCKETKQAVQ